MFSRHVVNKLSEYLDNALPAGERYAVERHLADCVSCRQELERLTAVSRKLGAWQVPELGPGFDDQVRNRIALRELQGGEKMKKFSLAWLRVPRIAMVPSGIFAGFIVFLFLTGVVGKFLVSNMQARVKAAYDGYDGMGARFDPDRSALQTAVRGVPRDGARVIVDNIKATYGFQGEAASFKKEFTGSWTGPDSVAAGRSPVSHLSKQSNAYEATMLGDPMSADLRVPRYGSFPATAQAPVLTENPAGQGGVIVIQPVLPATKDGEMVIRAAIIDLEVTDGQETYVAASRICQESGGYLGASNFTRDESGRLSGSIVMRIPKAQFLAALDKLSALGKVMNIASDSRDVTQEYKNVKAQLDAAMVVYNKMLEALQKKQTGINDALRLESEITPVLVKVQNLKNQLEALDNQVALATVTLKFHEADVSLKVLNETKSEFKRGMLATTIESIRAGIRCLPFAVAGAVLLAVIALVAGIVVPFIRASSKKEEKRDDADPSQPAAGDK